MKPSVRMILILCGAGLLTAGCQMPVAQQVPVGADVLTDAALSEDAASNTPANKTASADADDSGKAKSKSEDAAWEQSVQELVAELKDLDSELKSELVDNLRNTSPELREQTVRMYRAIAARQSQTSKPEAKPKAVAVEAIAEPQDAHSKAAGDKSPGEAVAAPVTQRLPQNVTGPATPSGTQVAAYPSTQSPTKLAESDAPKRVAASTLPQKVTLASHVVETSPDDLSWRSHLERTIASLKTQTRPDPSNSNEVRDHVALRMLLLAAGKREGALEPIPGVPLAQQDFWTKEFYGLSTYLDHEQNPDAGRRAGRARVYLSEASVILGELGTLDVRNLTFCSEARTYGVYKKFDKYEFKPGQEVVLYAEIENFSSEETESGFHTELRSSFQILDSSGKRVHAKDFAAIEDDCHSRRRDFPMRYNLFLPKRIWEGTYTLQLTIEDVHSLKIGQASIEFEIKE